MRYLYLNFTDTSLFMCPRYPTQLMLIMTLKDCVVTARPRAAVLTSGGTSVLLVALRPHTSVDSMVSSNAAFRCVHLLITLFRHFFPWQSYFTKHSDSTPLITSVLSRRIMKPLDMSCSFSGYSRGLGRGTRCLFLTSASLPVSDLSFHRLLMK